MQTYLEKNYGEHIGFIMADKNGVCNTVYDKDGNRQFYECKIGETLTLPENDSCTIDVKASPWYGFHTVTNPLALLNGDIKLVRYFLVESVGKIYKSGINYKMVPQNVDCYTNSIRVIKELSIYDILSLYKKIMDDSLDEPLIKYYFYRGTRFDYVSSSHDIMASMDGLQTNTYYDVAEYDMEENYSEVKTIPHRQMAKATDEFGVAVWRKDECGCAVTEEDCSVAITTDPCSSAITCNAYSVAVNTGYTTHDTGSAYAVSDSSIAATTNGDNKAVCIGGNCVAATTNDGAITYGNDSIAASRSISSSYSMAFGKRSVAVAMDIDAEARVYSSGSIALSFGIDSCSCGVIGSYLVLTDCDKTGNIKQNGVITIYIDGETYKPDTFYSYKDGKVYVNDIYIGRKIYVSNNGKS